MPDMPDLEVDEQHARTADGWLLHLRRTLSPAHFDPSTRPVVIIPGYGMNSFIFSYHPRGTSMERCLAEAGFEVWALDLRGQGPSRAAQPQPGPESLLAYATIDVSTATEHIAQATRTESTTVTLIGCSLGGSIAYAHLVLQPDHRVAGLIAMGAPLRWEKVQPLFRIAFASPYLAGAIPFAGTRTLIRTALPLLRRLPWLLAMYMNMATIDMDCMGELTKTVEDPVPSINRELAVWLRRKDLVLQGVNITRALRQVDLPLLVVLSNRDGIVPQETALTGPDAWGGDDVEILRVGTADNWYAHANLFVADDCPQLVFAHLIRWLRRTGSP